MLTSIALLALATAALARVDADTDRELLLSGRPMIGLWQAINDQAESPISHVQFASTPPPKYEAHCFEQRVSHFESGVNGTFCQRFWADAQYYKPGGPVFVLDGGETSGENRLKFMEKGILDILSQATNGLSIVLEHRYYGKSVPVPSLSTDDLRFLNNAEALEDSAKFIENFKPPASLNITHDLHPSKTPWIYYGGSYAGARAAHMRTQYPHLVWGGIGSSAVTHAQVDFPQYYDPIIKYADQRCMRSLQIAIEVIDSLLDLPEPVPSLIKGAVGLGNLTDADFASVLATPLGYWQDQNWDPAESTPLFDDFCKALTADKGSSKIGFVRIPAVIINYGKFVKENIVAKCPTDVVDCFGTNNDEKFRKTDLKETWRLWMFQVCTQWGYFMPAPSADRPTIVSRRLTLEYTSKICKQAFPPGKHFSVPEWPDVEEVNRRGDYGIEYSRLAFIDGDRDPWRPVTPQSDIAPKRNSSIDKPVHLIFNAIHHYDENGLKNRTEVPERIRNVHDFMVLFVQEWVARFHDEKAEGK